MGCKQAAVEHSGLAELKHKAGVVGKMLQRQGGQRNHGDSEDADDAKDDGLDEYRSVSHSTSLRCNSPLRMKLCGKA